ncbi:hypothetical protein K523DRAFT_415825 [Schizophyllum commune Tattone D]|nr:hypothetical protein K525DRAFT_209715 [Schizophyllum commune Loenen D]KAI5830483.1 hypothetical protein K523DRAFT_415825 [Schizophyllum commune Tattone D]
MSAEPQTDLPLLPPPVIQHPRARATLQEYLLQLVSYLMMYTVEFNTICSAGYVYFRQHGYAMCTDHAIAGLRKFSIHGVLVRELRSTILPDLWARAEATKPYVSGVAFPEPDSFWKQEWAASNDVAIIMKGAWNHARALLGTEIARLVSRIPTIELVFGETVPSLQRLAELWQGWKGGEDDLWFTQWLYTI